MMKHTYKVFLVKNKELQSFILQTTHIVKITYLRIVYINYANVTHVLPDTSIDITDLFLLKTYLYLHYLSIYLEKITIKIFYELKGKSRSLPEST